MGRRASSAAGSLRAKCARGGSKAGRPAELGGLGRVRVDVEGKGREREKRRATEVGLWRLAVGAGEKHAWVTGDGRRTGEMRTTSRDEERDGVRPRARRFAREEVSVRDENKPAEPAPTPSTRLSCEPKLSLDPLPPTTYIVTGSDPNTLLSSQAVLGRMHCMPSISIFAAHAPPSSRPCTGRHLGTVHTRAKVHFLTDSEPTK